MTMAHDAVHPMAVAHKATDPDLGWTARQPRTGEAGRRSSLVAHSHALDGSANVGWTQGTAWPGRAGSASVRPTCDWGRPFGRPELTIQQRGSADAIREDAVATGGLDMARGGKRPQGCGMDLSR